MNKRNNIPFLAVLKNPLALLMLLLFLGEACYKVLSALGWPEFKVSAVLKVVLQAFFLWQILKSNYKKLWGLAVLFGFFLIGQLEWLTQPIFIKNVWFFDKYAFLFLTLLYVQSLKDPLKYFPILKKTFEGILITNSLIIFIGWIFGLEVFRTYEGMRFGYNGLILRSGAATYIYGIALFYAAHKLITGKKWVLFVVVAPASVLIGSKSIFIFWLFVALYMIWASGWLQKMAVKIPLALLAIATVLFWKPFLQWVFTLSPIFSKVTQESGFMAALFSYRDVLLREETLPFIRKEWDMVNYLFGGGYDMHLRSQFGALDLLFFFGIIGTCWFFYLFWKYFVTFKWTGLALWWFIAMMVVMALSAHFFYETVIVMYLVFTKLYLEKIKTT